jgi:hypothetical protein
MSENGQKNEIWLIESEGMSYSRGSFKVPIICHLLVTYCLTYFTTYLIMRTRRRAISDRNKNNELHLPLFLFAHLFTHFLLCLSIHLFSIQTPIDLFIDNLETCANPSPSSLSTAANAVPMPLHQHQMAKSGKLRGRKIATSHHASLDVDSINSRRLGPK